MFEPEPAPSVRPSAIHIKTIGEKAAEDHDLAEFRGICAETPGEAAGYRTHYLRPALQREVVSESGKVVSIASRYKELLPVPSREVRPTAWRSGGFDPLPSTGLGIVSSSGMYPRPRRAALRVYGDRDEPRTGPNQIDASFSFICPATIAAGRSISRRNRGPRVGRWIVYCATARRRSVGIPIHTASPDCHTPARNPYRIVPNSLGGRFV